MRNSAVLLSLALASVPVWGCADQKPQEEPTVDVSLAPYVLDEVPSDVPNPTFFDFEGKVHLVGWKVEPEGTIKEGEKFKLTLYWKSVARLSPGWRLFTHLVARGGQRVANPDDVGLLRSRLQPSDWQPGKVYVDVQELEMPRGTYSEDITITVGVWKDKARLDVISGPSDNERRAIVTHIDTGYVRQAATEQPATRERTAPMMPPGLPPGNPGMPRIPPRGPGRMPPPAELPRPAAPAPRE
jgi:hypothetical protein